MRAHITFLALLLMALTAPTAKDKSKPVRHALELRYAELKRATETRDFDLFQSLRTPTFSSSDLAGHRSSSEEMKARAKRMFESWRPPIRAKFSLGPIDLQGDKAVVTVRQELSRMQTVGTRLRQVDTKVTQDETWLRTPTGWKLDYVDHERDLLWCVDGRRVKPGVPYNPAAAPYDPGHSGGVECRTLAPPF
jgi:hypothetical protein